MTRSRNAVLVFGAFMLGFWLLTRTGAVGDAVLGNAIWVAVAAMSVIVIVKTIRHGAGRRGTYGQDAAMPDGIRRWVLGKPDADPDGRSGRGLAEGERE